MLGCGVVVWVAQSNPLPAAVRRDEHDARVFQRSGDGLHRRSAWRAVTLLEVQQRLKVDARGGRKVSL